jgi:hypothetical protein
MILTLDNLDGLGPVDYSTAIDRSKVLTITRSLNAPSILEGLLCLEGSALKLPVRQARVTATAQAGAVLFTGYLTVEPVAIYAGAASAGPVYRYVLSAVSDEWLLDKQSAGSLLGAAFAQAAGVLLRQLVSRLAPGLLRTAAVPAGRRARRSRLRRVPGTRRSLDPDLRRNPGPPARGRRWHAVDRGLAAGCGQGARQ